MSVHIGAEKGQVAETVLLPGDPLRAKFIAETFLEDAVCYNNVRGMLGFTGKYKGKRISVQGSGMGVPSISIYVSELLKFYDVKTIMRIGSCGSIQSDVKIRDIVLAMSSSTNSAVNNQRFNGNDYSPTADFGLLKKAYDISIEKGIEPKVGQIFTSDEFYQDDPDWWKIYSEHGVLAVEMETTALYTLAAKYKARALTILTVSDSLVTWEETTSEEREKTFTDMMEIALETA